MYPEPCGYRYDEGGIMKNLRESCSNVKVSIITQMYGQCSPPSLNEMVISKFLFCCKVRNYHKKYYRPENLTLIIAGQVKPEDVFAALAPIESKIVSKVSSRFKNIYKKFHCLRCFLN